MTEPDPPLATLNTEQLERRLNTLSGRVTALELTLAKVLGTEVTVAEFKTVKLGAAING